MFAGTIQLEANLYRMSLQSRILANGMLLALALGLVPAEAKPPRVLAIGIGGLSSKAVAMRENGNFVLAWKSPRGLILFKRFSSSGKVLARKVKVAVSKDPDKSSIPPTLPHTLLRGSPPSVATDRSGNILVAWVTSSPERAIKARLFDSSGTPLGNELQISSTAEITVSFDIAMADDGRFVAIWYGMPKQSGSATPSVAQMTAGLRFRRYSNSGSAETEPLPIADVATTNPIVTLSNDGSVLAAWKSDQLRIKCFDSSGLPLGATIDLTANTVKYPLLRASLAVGQNSDGGFDVAWNQTKGSYATPKGGDTGYAELMTRRFRSGCEPEGNATMVTETTGYLDGLAELTVFPANGGAQFLTWTFADYLGTEDVDRGERYRQKAAYRWSDGTTRDLRIPARVRFNRSVSGNRLGAYVISGQSDDPASEYAPIYVAARLTLP